MRLSFSSYVVPPEIRCYDCTRNHAISEVMVYVILITGKMDQIKHQRKI